MSKLSSLGELFTGRHFNHEVIIVRVCWYLRYKFGFRDLVERMAERGLNLAHATILRGVRRYTPEFVTRWNCFSPTAGRSWRRTSAEKDQCGVGTCVNYATRRRSQLLYSSLFL